MFGVNTGNRTAVEPIDINRLSECDRGITNTSALTGSDCLFFLIQKKEAGK